MERKGGWFITPYQCRKIWFVNVYERLPRRLSVGDSQTLDVLRRANFDIFWSRETENMKIILGYTKEIVRRAREEGGGGGGGGTITRNRSLDCQRKGGHSCGYPNA